MMAEDVIYDLCIIGAGMFGSAAAKYASEKPGVKVCLIDTMEIGSVDLKSCQSYPLDAAKTNDCVNPGNTNISFCHDESRIVSVLDDTRFRQILAIRSMNKYKDIENSTGINFHSADGCLTIGDRNGQLMQNFADLDNKRNLRKSPKKSQTFTPNTNTMYPQLHMNDEECAILHEYGSGHINVTKLVEAQMKLAKERGCHIVKSRTWAVKTKYEKGHELVHQVYIKQNGIIRAKKLLGTTAFTPRQSLLNGRSLMLHRCAQTAVLLKLTESERKRLSSLPLVKFQRKSKGKISGEIGTYIIPPVKYPDGNYYLKFGNLNEYTTVVKRHLYSREDSDIISTHLPLVTELLNGLEFEDTIKLTCTTHRTPSSSPYIDRVSPTITVAISGCEEDVAISDEVGRISAAYSLSGVWDSDVQQLHFMMELEGSMDPVYDVCVVGAGMFGSAAARHASANRVLKVCLIGPNEPTEEERPHRDIFGAHYDEGRITRILDMSPECQKLAKHSTDRYRGLEESYGIKFYNPVGCLFWGKKDGQFLTNLSKSGEKGEVPLISIPDENTMKTRFPFLKINEDECALFDDNGAGYISPRRLVWAQKKVSQIQGCRIIDSVVTDVSTLKNGIHQVETACKEIIRAKRIIFATGAFANLKRMAALKSVALKRCKETVVLIKIPEEEAKRLKSMPAIIRRWEADMSSPSTIGAYILPPIKYPDGNFYLKFGRSGTPDQENEGVISSSEEMKTWYLSQGDERILDTHLEFVKEMIPDLKFYGLRTVPCALSYSPTGLPYIDRISPTVTVALAGNGKGAKLSDEIGRIAAHLCIYGEWDSEIPKEMFKVVLE